MAHAAYSSEFVEQNFGDKQLEPPKKKYNSLAVFPISARVYLSVYKDEHDDTFLTVKRYGKDVKTQRISEHPNSGLPLLH